MTENSKTPDQSESCQKLGLLGTILVISHKKIQNLQNGTVNYAPLCLYRVGTQFQLERIATTRVSGLQLFLNAQDL